MHTTIACTFTGSGATLGCPMPTGASLSRFGVEVKPPGGLARLLPIGEKTLGDLSTKDCTAEGIAACKLVFTACSNSLNRFFALS